jgi:hypothetical protein
MDSLVEAKREFLYKLCMVMIPHMNQSFYQLYVDAEVMCKGYQPLIQFQKLLREVPNWNNNIVKEKTTEITKEFPMYGRLINITNVSFIKIMLSVRLTGERRKIRIKPLVSEDFVHECYKKAAQELYKDPKIFMKNVNEYEREADLTSRFSVCIKDAMDSQIPMHEILMNLMNEESESFNFDEAQPEPEAEEEEQQPMSDEMPATEEQMQELANPEASDEVRNIPVANEPMPISQQALSPQGESDDLFPGAADSVEQRNVAPGA